jgi:hypothetical protein
MQSVKSPRSLSETGDAIHQIKECAHYGAHYGCSAQSDTQLFKLTRMLRIIQNEVNSMRILAYSLLTLLASCGSSNIRQLDCTVTSTHSPDFGKTGSLIIDVKSGDGYYLREDAEGLFLAPSKEQVSIDAIDADSIRYESKIVGNIYMYIYQIDYDSSMSFSNRMSIDLKSLKYTYERSGTHAKVSSKGVCEWSEPVTTKIAEQDKVSP